MARLDDRSAQRHGLVCPSCKREFFSYGPDLVQDCPYCGRSVRTRSRRRTVRVGAVILILAIAAVALVVYYYGTRR